MGGGCTWFDCRALLNNQRAKKVVSDSKPGASGFCYRASEFCFLLVQRASDVFKAIRVKEDVKIVPLNKKLLGLVEMTSGLVNASFSLPEWQAVKMIFFAPKNRSQHYLNARSFQYQKLK